MKTTKLMASLVLLGTAITGSGAHAGNVQDAWTMSALGTTTSNIGHLGLNGADNTFTMQVGMGGTPFVGSKFEQFGQVFSINYVIENVPGLGDFGFPQNFAQPLDGFRLVFTGLSGVVTSYDTTTGKIEYSYDQGVGSIKLQATSDGAASWVDMADLVMSGPSTGDLSDFNGQAQTLGQRLQYLQFQSFLNGFSLDLFGAGLGYTNANELFLRLSTTDKISNPFAFTGACSFDNTALCAVGKITSDGSMDLIKGAQSVPEPGSLALLALGLIGLGAGRRRRAA